MQFFFSILVENWLPTSFDGKYMIMCFKAFLSQMIISAFASHWPQFSLFTWPARCTSWQLRDLGRRVTIALKNIAMLQKKKNNWDYKWNPSNPNKRKYLLFDIFYQVCVCRLLFLNQPNRSGDIEREGPKNGSWWLHGQEHDENIPENIQIRPKHSTWSMRNIVDLGGVRGAFFQTHVAACDLTTQLEGLGPAEQALPHWACTPSKFIHSSCRDENIKQIRILTFHCALYSYKNP